MPTLGKFKRAASTSAASTSAAASAAASIRAVQNKALSRLGFGGVAAVGSLEKAVDVLKMIEKN